MVMIIDRFLGFEPKILIHFKIMEKNLINIMESMTGAKALMTAMEKEGVKEVFGLPGGANLPMYDEFSRCDIRHILVRHEQSASHMADGFGRVSRKPGVCFATSGPGATNILTGIATAQADSAPMIAVTGQVPVAMIGKDAFQESDIIGMANPCCKIFISTKGLQLEKYLKL